MSDILREYTDTDEIPPAQAYTMLRRMADEIDRLRALESTGRWVEQGLEAELAEARRRLGLGEELAEAVFAWERVRALVRAFLRQDIGVQSEYEQLIEARLAARRSILVKAEAFRASLTSAASVGGPAKPEGPASGASTGSSTTEGEGKDNG